MARMPELIRTLPQIERSIHAALKERSAKDISRVGRIGMSQIGKCERFLWAALNGEKPEQPSGRVLTLFQHGNAVEQHVIELLESAGFRVLSEEDGGGQFRVSDPELIDFVGHLDGKISLQGDANWSLLEIKSANTKQFELLKEAGYEKWKPDYGAQIHAYMGYGQLASAVVVVYCKDTSEIYAERIRFDLDKFSALKAKAGRIFAAETLPERPEEAKSRHCKFCKFCDLGDWCWGPLAGVKFDD